MKKTNYNNKFTKEKIQWRTISEYVDTETGEIITKNEAINNYIIIKKTKHYAVRNTKGTTTVTNECRRTNQRRLF